MNYSIIIVHLLCRPPRTTVAIARSLTNRDIRNSYVKWYHIENGNHISRQLLFTECWNAEVRFESKYSSWRLLDILTKTRGGIMKILMQRQWSIGSSSSACWNMAPRVKQNRRLLGAGWITFVTIVIKLGRNNMIKRNKNRG